MGEDQECWKKIDSAARLVLDQERTRFSLATEAELAKLAQQALDPIQQLVCGTNMGWALSSRIEAWGRLVRDSYLRQMDGQGVVETPALLTMIFERAVIPEIRNQARDTFLLFRRLGRKWNLSSEVIAAEAYWLSEYTSAIIRDCRKELKRELQAIRGTAKRVPVSRKGAKDERSLRAIAERPPQPVTAQGRSKIRAKKVAKLIKELDTLKPQMQSENSYGKLRLKYPKFLTFQIADEHTALREKLVAIAESRRHIRLAQELAAAHRGRALTTIQTDWKRNKPKSFRNTLS